MPPPDRPFAIMKFDLATMELQPLVWDDPRQLYPKSWTEVGEVILGSYFDMIWALNPESGGIQVIGTPTPWADFP